MLIRPARTPATTSALRRMTQRRVPGGGKSSMLLGWASMMLFCDGLNSAMAMLGIPIRISRYDDLGSDHSYATAI